MSLRDDIGVQPDPDFDLELPRGWGRHEVSDRGLDDAVLAVKRRCMEQHQPQLFPELKSSLEDTFAQMRSAGVFAYFAPTDPAPSTLAFPSSINASIRKSEPGQSLDDVVRSLVKSNDAAPLLGDARTLRFETERIIKVGGQSVVSHSAIYLTPIPGSMRRRALMLVAGFARPPEVPAQAPSMQGARALFDACVSTLQWRAPVTST